jgi:hypothetical protein
LDETSSIPQVRTLKYNVNSSLPSLSLKLEAYRKTCYPTYVGTGTYLHGVGDSIGEYCHHFASVMDDTTKFERKLENMLNNKLPGYLKNEYGEGI